MRISIRVAVPAFFILSGAAAGQDYRGFPTPESIRPLALFPIRGTVPVYRSAGISKAEAAGLQRAMSACVAKYRRSTPVIPKVELAILDSASWKRVSVLPYGLPHHNPVVSPVVVVVPTTAGKMFSTEVTGVRADRLDRFFHLLALHELGHVLMFAVIGVDRARPWDQRHFPDWYLEFTANYVSLSCLSDRPADASLLRGSEASLRALPPPSFTKLDEFPRVLTMETEDGAPYAFTKTGAAHFSWYQRLMSEAAGRVWERLGLRLVPLLRTQWARHEPVTTEDIVEDLSQSSPELRSWLRSFGAIP